MSVDEDRASLLQLAWLWLGERETDPSVRRLIANYRQAMRDPGIADDADWCLIWAMWLIRRERPRRPWHGSVSQLHAWLLEHRAGELVPIGASLAGDLVCRPGHCGIALAETAAITIEGNVGDRVQVVTDGELYRDGWAWRWWWG